MPPELQVFCFCCLSQVFSSEYICSITKIIQLRLNSPASSTGRPPCHVRIMTFLTSMLNNNSSAISKSSGDPLICILIFLITIILQDCTSTADLFDHNAKPQRADLLCTE